MGTGTRGARDHGWFVNYRKGKGGRHLQGEYYDRESIQECCEWNEAIFALGSQYVYLDVVVRPRQLKKKAFALTTAPDQSSIDPNVNQKNGEDTGLGLADVDIKNESKEKHHRLTIELATTVMETTAENFIALCTDCFRGYTNTSVYRIEPGVGLCCGDVLTDTGRTGQAARDVVEKTMKRLPRGSLSTILTLPVASDPLALWHVPGTVSMIVRKVDEVDSRFMLCTHHAPQLDGIHRAVGRLATPESITTVQQWESSILTRYGMPTAFDLVIVASGKLDKPSTVYSITDNTDR
jgi:cyclophilin family peptidyl-prolyl cis-trans isomerase